MQNSGGQDPGQTRNVIIAIALSAAILFGFEFFYNMPQRERLMAERQAAEAAQQAQAPAATTEGGTPQAPRPAGPLPREQVIAAAEGARVAIDTPSVDGSILLQGGRFDDLNLRNYRRTVEPDSPEVTLLSPIDAEFGHDAFFGWEMQRGEAVSTLADAFSGWTAAEGATLTQDSPITLTLAVGEGVTITRTISIDQDYMFTITDVVRNESGTQFSARPFGTVRRVGLPSDYRANPIIHQGLVGSFGPGNRRPLETYDNARKHARDRDRGRVGEDERIEEAQGQGGWLGITDHYWLTALVPDQGERISGYYDARNNDNQTDFRAAYRGQWHAVPAGGEVTYTQRLFAGAKRVEVLQRYEEEHSIPQFDWAIDWGNFWFLTRPFYLWILHPLGQWMAALGVAFSFGVGILLTTIVVKALLFPLVYHSFKAMGRMRMLQPKMKEIQERYAADKQRQQQELLRLYQTEKINPVSGCLPILLQIPVFYALYKVLSNTIEMRHAPFFGWINDLSAPDPTSIFNLFGIFPAIGFDFHTLPVLGLIPAIGVWPILYGLSMWALQQLSPPPTDPIQKQIFGLLPILFTVMFAGFAVGMVIYWTWSNILSMLQQYVITRRQGGETQFDLWLKKRREKAAAAE